MLSTTINNCDSVLLFMVDTVKMVLIVVVVFYTATMYTIEQKNLVFFCSLLYNGDFSLNIKRSIQLPTHTSTPNQ